jgi:hypothetical protein
VRVFIFLLLVACGGGSSSHAPEKPKQAEKPDPYWEWHKSQPKSPEQPMRTTKFEPPQQCGQGPYRIAVDTLATNYSESFEVVICTSKGFKGTVSYQAPGYSKSEYGFGDGEHKDNEKCRVDATVVTNAGSGSGSGTGKAAPTGKGGIGTKKVETAKTQELEAVLVETGEKCPTGTSELRVVSSGFSLGDEPRGAAPGVKSGALVIEMWSALPNDLAGASILVRQKGVPDGYKLEDWIAYRRAWDAWYKQREDKLAQSRAQGHKWRTVERPVATKQPPPAKSETQPPKPSPNAAWIPGYWQDTDGWVWSAGFWRVPQQDIEQEKTVETATPPPAPKAEKPPDVAYYSARKAIWTPGYWMWNGSGYIWIAGSWRIPEGVEMRWVAPTWRPTRRGTLIYVPGGFVRVGPRR